MIVLVLILAGVAFILMKFFSQQANPGYSLSQCWNEVQYGNGGLLGEAGPPGPRYFWPDCSGGRVLPSGQGTCFMTVELTPQEITEYNNWVKAGKPKISGC